MAIFRSVNMSFWTDTKITDDFTPEDKYFMLYALTNQYTNIIGCYEISIKQMSNDLGYKADVVKILLDRFQNVHKTIFYDFDTKELYISNWSKYNWNASSKLDSALFNAIQRVKSDAFYNELVDKYNKRESIEESLPSRTVNGEVITELTIYSEEVQAPKRVIDRTDYKMEFEEVWKEYPRKQGKANALKAYIKARKNGIEKQTILEGIFNYIDYLKAEKTAEKYIKQGSTWFNQECWNDDYIIRQKATTKNIDIDISDF